MPLGVEEGPQLPEEFSWGHIELEGHRLVSWIESWRAFRDIKRISCAGEGLCNGSGGRHNVSGGMMRVEGWLKGGGFYRRLKPQVRLWPYTGDVLNVDSGRSGAICGYCDSFT